LDQGVSGHVEIYMYDMQYGRNQVALRTTWFKMSNLGLSKAGQVVSKWVTDTTTKT